MELVDLEIFIAVSEERSMNKASRRMFMAQSAISTRMQNLERELGFPLFTRTRSGVQLTSTGIRFLKYAIGSISAIRQGERRLSRDTDERPVLIGTTRSLAVQYVPEILTLCQRTDRSKVLETVTASSDEILILIRSGALDAGLVYDTKPPAGVHSIPLRQEDIVLVSHEPAVSFRDFLVFHPIVLLQHRGNIEQNLELLMEMMNIPDRRVIARVDNMEVLIELVRKGIGNAIIPRSYLQPSHLHDGNIYVQKAPSLLPGRTVYVVWNERVATEFTEKIIGKIATATGAART